MRFRNSILYALNRLIQSSMVVLLVVILSSCSREISESDPSKPNIIYIFTDQQHANMMSAAGNKWVKTPAMDYIAAHGIRFTRAYTPNPVCSPARVSLMTGRFAGDFKDSEGNMVRENRGSMRIPEVSKEVEETTIASFLQKAGYDLLYGGKEHLPDPLTPEALGFIDFSDDERDQLAEQAAAYISSEPKNPYFMIVSLIQPHDICYMAIRDQSDPANPLLERGKKELAMLDLALQYPDSISEEEFFQYHCPPVPPNYEPQHEEPEAIRHMLSLRDFRINARKNYTQYDWRRHRWAYSRLTEKVDSQIQLILDALIESGEDQNTLVLFSSDHGDMDGAFRMEHKTALYEEATNVPFMAMWKGNIPAGQIDSVHLVSSGLDLLPTVCDYAGVTGSSDPRGRSLRPLMEGKEVAWRKTLGVESEIGWMVVDENKLKYIRYDAVGTEERLHDLNQDPYETTHFTSDPEYTEKLEHLRQELIVNWFPRQFQ